MNIAELFFEAAHKYPDRVAITYNNRQISYRQLANEVEQTAAYLKKKEIKAGDRVLVFIPMSVDLYRIVLALFYIGATAVFLDEWVSKERLRICCRLADCKAFVGIPKARIFGLFIKELREIPIKISLKGRDSAPIKIAQVEAEHSALITFTTGSTGIPKAADRSHGFLAQQFEALIKEIDPKPEDVDMPVLPIVLFVNLGIGSTSVIASFKASKPESLKPQKIADLIKRHQVNRITASPFFLRRLSEYALAADQEFSTVQKTFTGGAPVFPSEASLYVRAFPNADCKIVYGSTEAEPISAILATELIAANKDIEKGLAVGAPFKDVEIRIIDIVDAPLAKMEQHELEKMQKLAGDIGEIIVAGDHVLRRYFRNEEAFRENKIKVGAKVWHRTGDSGFIKDGQLFLTGRCKELIKAEDGYISTFLIENRLQEIPQVSCGTLIEIEGQKTLVLESDASIDDLEPQLKGFKYDRFLVQKSIPRDPRHHSKIDYAKLRLNLRD